MPRCVNCDQLQSHRSNRLRHKKLQKKGPVSSEDKKKGYEEGLSMCERVALNPSKQNGREARLLLSFPILLNIR